MKKQLALIEAPNRVWRLDRKTIETGRRGVAQAREALQQAAERARDTEAAGSAA